MLDCFTNGYQKLTDLEFKENMSYDDTEADLREMNKRWTALKEETRSKIKETVEYFGQFEENEPEDSKFVSIKERASLLKEEFLTLLKRHSDLAGRIEVDPAIVERQYNYSKTMRDQIVTHARNALLAAILLGFILGGVIAWRTYDGRTLPIVFGVLIGGGSVALVGTLLYLVLVSVAKRGVKRWEGLQQRISQLNALYRHIDEKAGDLYPVPKILLDRIINKSTSVRKGSSALIKQCDKYNENLT